MSRAPILVLMAAATLGLAGCASPPDRHELSRSTVEYACGPGGEQPLTVHYTFRGDEVVSARVIHMNKVMDMTRVTAGTTDMVGHTFRGGGHSWTTASFDRNSVNEAPGDMLVADVMASGYGVPPSAAQYGQPTATGPAPAGTVGTMLVRDCRVRSVSAH